MIAVLDAFWRAGAYCLHPRVILLSLLPLLVAGLSGGLGWFYWEAAVAGVRGVRWSSRRWWRGAGWLDRWSGPANTAACWRRCSWWRWRPRCCDGLAAAGGGLMTPAMVNLVATRRFPALERKRGAGLVAAALFWSLACTLRRCWRWLSSIPLWLVPPLVLVLPPLIWGWLNYRVMAFDVLADHASAGRAPPDHAASHRWPLLAHGRGVGLPGCGCRRCCGRPARLTLVLAPLLMRGVGVAVHAGVRLRGAVVRPLCAGRAGRTARPSAERRPRGAAHRRHHRRGAAPRQPFRRPGCRTGTSTACTLSNPP
jgi:hypothetical protein